MQYFSLLPNVFVGEGITDDEPYRYRLVKNLFRRTKLREDLDQYITLLETRIIPNGMRPEEVALQTLGDPYLDWILLMVNEVTDVYEQWPRSEERLIHYVQSKYDLPDGIHHYETVEAKYNNVVVLKQGITVNGDWRTVLPDGTTLGADQSIYPVTNYEHERYINDKKAILKIPTQPVVEFILSEFEELISYKPHKELDKEGNKKTELSAAARFLESSGYVTGSVNLSTSTGTVTSFDNGPTTSSASVGVVSSSTTTDTTTTTTPVGNQASETNTTSSTSSSSSSSSRSSSSSSGYGY